MILTTCIHSCIIIYFFITFYFQGVTLNNTFTKPIKQLFLLKKIVGVTKWLILLISLGGLGASGYLHFKKSTQSDIYPVQKQSSVLKLERISDLNARTATGHDNPAISNRELDKY